MNNPKLELIKKERRLYIAGDTVMADFLAGILDYIIELEEKVNKMDAAYEDEPVGWIEGPHGAIRANPLHKYTGPTTLDWSIPLYTKNG